MAGWLNLGHPKHYLHRPGPRLFRPSMGSRHYGDEIIDCKRMEIKRQPGFTLIELLVAVTCKNPGEQRSGHTAVIRPQDIRANPIHSGHKNLICRRSTQPLPFCV
ncbi:MAG TPA: hypothetical protein DCQ92_14105 [Verrucomicrobia subdivision 3 bacterium]|nr:hypothetical protein [Limisphaerales bacterium]